MSVQPCSTQTVHVKQREPIETVYSRLVDYRKDEIQIRLRPYLLSICRKAVWARVLGGSSCECGTCGPESSFLCHFHKPLFTWLFSLYCQARERGEPWMADAVVEYAAAVIVYRRGDVARVPIAARAKESRWMNDFAFHLRSLTYRWVTTRDAARIMGCTERHVRRLANKGTFASARMGPAGHWLVDPADVLRHAIDYCDRTE